uniref:RE01762p n=1 Tax=Drosophila melanogaster TaxID=7227 RepID=C9QPJ8_DROME|nr:RE01762p [Drosophila melanogaster]
MRRKLKTLNTAVVQIYKTEGSAHAHWKKRHTGVVCFVKDSAIRSYFMRAYCLIKNELIWEHEIYDGMEVVKSRPFLLTFEGSDGHVGLNFVSEEECDSFFRIVDATIETRNRKRQEKRNRQKSQQAPNAPLPQVQREPARPPPMQGGLSSTDGVQLRNNKINSVTLTPAPAPAQSKNFLSSSFGLGNNAKDKKRKVTKADISRPTNFVHLSHVGWDAQKGFDLAGNENDEVLNEFFVKAGVSEVELKDRDTRAFIYDFIQSNNVLASVKQYSVESPRKQRLPCHHRCQPVIHLMATKELLLRCRRQDNHRPQFPLLCRAPHELLHHLTDHHPLAPLHHRHQSVRLLWRRHLHHRHHQQRCRHHRPRPCQWERSPSLRPRTHRLKQPGQQLRRLQIHAMH